MYLINELVLENIYFLQLLLVPSVCSFHIDAPTSTSLSFSLSTIASSCRSFSICNLYVTLALYSCFIRFISLRSICWLLKFIAKQNVYASINMCTRVCLCMCMCFSQFFDFSSFLFFLSLSSIALSLAFMFFFSFFGPDSVSRKHQMASYENLLIVTYIGLSKRNKFHSKMSFYFPLSLGICVRAARLVDGVVKVVSVVVPVPPSSYSTWFFVWLSRGCCALPHRALDCQFLRNNVCSREHK